MGKGLFEKRIIERLSVLERNIRIAKKLGDDIAVHSYEDEKKIYHFMLKLVDEVRKEFPQTNIIEILKPIVSKDVVQQVKKELYRYFEWCTTWFGDEK